VRSSSITGRTIAIGVVAALIGVAIGIAVVTTSGSDARDDAVLTAMDSSAERATPPLGSMAPSDGAADAADAAAAEVSEAAVTGASEAPGRDAGAEARTTALVPSCVDATARRDDAIEAAATALGNWKAHYGAQLAFDQGEISSDEAKRRWAASKEPAERNLTALADAVEAISADEPCRQLVDDGAVSGATVDEIEACVTRSDRANGALEAAEEPLQGWRDHLQLMAAKDEYSTDEYLRIWDRMVGAAPGEMQPFDRALAQWRDTPACEPSA
jgi:hypothetical protein